MAGILRYEHVDIAYRDMRAVRDISLSIGEGEILGIVGESGSGKTTLIRAAMGLLGSAGCITGGRIFYRDRDLADLAPQERRKLNGAEMGMIFQNAGASFCPVRTVGAQMYESMREHERVTRKQFRVRAQELLEKLGFDSGERVLESYPFELSGGMQQRAGIAAAMLLRPSVLMADEPTAALDVTAQRQVVEEMKKVRDSFGTSILIVTHNIGVVGAMADHVLVMKDGKMVEYGETQQVLRHPEQAYTRRLMAAVPRMGREGK